LFACTQRSADGCSCLLARVPGTDVRTRWLPFFWVLCCGGDRDRPASRLSVQTQIKGTPDLMKTRAAASNHTKQQRSQGTRRAATTRTRTEDERVPNERRRQGRQAAAGRTDASIARREPLALFLLLSFQVSSDRSGPTHLGRSMMGSYCLLAYTERSYRDITGFHSSTHMDPPLLRFGRGLPLRYGPLLICALGLFDSLSPVRPIYTFGHLLKQRQST